jgi:hypothetical protein
MTYATFCKYVPILEVDEPPAGASVTGQQPYLSTRCLRLGRSQRLWWQYQGAGKWRMKFWKELSRFCKTDAEIIGYLQGHGYR